MTKPYKRRVYIAGPMRGYPQFNFPAFDKARDLGNSLGWDCISPADIDRSSGVHENSNPNFSPEDIRTFATRDCNTILSLRSELGDAIALLPGWENSRGAVSEFFLSRWVGLAILDARNFLPFDGKLETFRQYYLLGVNK